MSEQQNPGGWDGCEIRESPPVPPPPAGSFPKGRFGFVPSAIAVLWGHRSSQSSFLSSANRGHWSQSHGQHCRWEKAAFVP